MPRVTAHLEPSSSDQELLKPLGLVVKFGYEGERYCAIVLTEVGMERKSLKEIGC